MNAVDIVLAIGSFLVAIISVVIALLSLSRSKKKDTQSDSKNEGVIVSDIGYIKAGVDDLKSENRETRKELQGMTERITRCEESAKQAHRRIDSLSKYHEPHE